MWLKIIVCLLSFYLLKAYGADSDIDNHPSWKYMSRTKCGITRLDNAQARIIGGEKASLGQFPWMVRIGYVRFILLEPEFVCAGSLISRYHVLTAGHCDTKNNVVRVGENNVKTNRDCEEDVCAPRPQDIRIKKYLLDVYDKATTQDDINLLYLARAVRINEFVVPVCLPYGELLDKDLLGKHMVIAGWGYTNSSYDSQPNNLLYVKEPVVNQSLCNALYKNPLTENQYCIGFPEGKDTCNGDSGGPAIKSMKLNNVRQMYQYAIVSYGLVECGNGPAVYTAVDKYMKLILDNMDPFNKTTRH